MAGLVQKFKDMWNPPEDEYDYDYEDDQEVDVMNSQDEREEVREHDSIKRAPSNSGSNKVVNIHATAQLQVVLFKPERFGEDTRAVADELLKMHTVVLNLENTNKDVSRRIIDFLSGVAYANGGKIKRVATSTFIITPYNVDLTGDDVLDELENNGVYF
ncbi:MAG TPA: cell division protein SepF [Oscillospiraceae bacterium]|nr:cell division protein SepF [Oscillospiraceae bacterium]